MNCKEITDLSHPKKKKKVFLSKKPINQEKQLMHRICLIPFKLIHI